MAHHRRRRHLAAAALALLLLGCTSTFEECVERAGAVPEGARDQVERYCEQEVRA